jgi:TetR/AcrR family transcriptional repressor of nem operon
MSNNGRPLQYDPEQALEAAMQVFWSHGYEATSLQDLLAAMGLSKSSFYQAFGGKKALFIRCISRYRNRMTDVFNGVLNKAESGLKFIELLLLLSAAEARKPDHLRRGCLLMNTATEFAQNDQEVAKHVTAGFGGLQDALRAAVLSGQREGDISPDHNPDILADYLLSSLGGIKTMVKGGMSEKQVKEIVAITLRALR